MRSFVYRIDLEWAAILMLFLLPLLFVLELLILMNASSPEGSLLPYLARSPGIEMESVILAILLLSAPVLALKTEYLYSREDRRMVDRLVWLIFGSYSVITVLTAVRSGQGHWFLALLSLVLTIFVLRIALGSPEGENLRSDQ